jgi:Ca2+-binding EF-hand superfamily protein
MAPKRKPPAASSSAATTPAKRRSKLAKDNDISADEEAEIQEAFSLFATKDTQSKNKEGTIASSDVRRCLIALNTPPSDAEELQEILDTVDPDGSGWVTYEHFVAVAALKLRAKHEDPEAMSEEVMKAYQLFTKGQDREITLNDLRRVARELREDIPDNVLKDMMREATSGEVPAHGGVSVDQFEDVMKRAGVFG